MYPKKIIKYIIFFVAFLFFFGGLLTLGFYFQRQQKALNGIQQLVELREVYAGAISNGKDAYDADTGEAQQLQLTYQQMKEQNPDFYGWIQISDTNINYPVMQRDNEYYLNHGFDGETSSMGLPFIDERCNLGEEEEAVIIYGHNIKSGAMFHTLLNYQEEEFLKAHPIIYLDTLTERKTYSIISVRLFDDQDILPAIEAEEGVLVLMTCSYHVKNGRFAVYAKQIHPE